LPGYDGSGRILNRGICGDWIIDVSDSKWNKIPEKRQKGVSPHFEFQAVSGKYRRTV
jgi:hypothetical protein